METTNDQARLAANQVDGCLKRAWPISPIDFTEHFTMAKGFSALGISS